MGKNEEAKENKRIKGTQKRRGEVRRERWCEKKKKIIDKKTNEIQKEGTVLK